jgi:hypothetical protein
VLFALHVLNINSFFFGCPAINARAVQLPRELLGRGNGSPWQHTLAQRIKTRGRIMKVMWKFGYAAAAKRERQWQPESKHLSPGEHLLAIGFLELESGFSHAPW